MDSAEDRPVSRGRSLAVRRLVRAGLLVAVLAATVLVVAGSGAVTSSACAGVLRLTPGTERPSPAAACVIAADGERRALPAVDVPNVTDVDASDLLAAPDGTHVLLTTFDVDARATVADRRLTLLATADGTRRTLKIDGRAILEVSGEPTWTTDGSALVISAVRPVLPDRDRRRRVGRVSAARCVAATGVCRRLPGTGSRIAAPLPDGRVVASESTLPASDRRTPCRRQLSGIEIGIGGGPYAAGGRCDRFLAGFLRRRVALDTRIFAAGRPSRRIAGTTGDLRRGVPLADSAIPSTTGVLIERARVGLRRSHPDSRHPTLDNTVRSASALLVNPTGRTTVVAAPNVVTSSGRRATTSPQFPLPSGGWLGSVGGQNGGRQAELLTITSATGRSSVLPVSGAPSTPFAVARAAGVDLPKDDVQMSLAGYERATDSAVVVVSALARATAASATSGGETASEEDAPPAGALVRVPLTGGAPTVIERVADGDAQAFAAW